jgi:eukaryotic-like serine/threonine-protein kinase
MMKAGERLGPYEELSRIRKGGMGEVYFGRDTRLNRSVAIKVPAAEFSERFAHDTLLVAALNSSQHLDLIQRRPEFPGDGTRRGSDAC